jgi:hypothetical protein
VFDRIYHELEEIRTELKVGAARSVFEKTRFEIIYERDPKTGEIRSITRDFKLVDKEVNRDDIESGVGNWGYLDLTPYSSCITHRVSISSINVEMSPTFEVIETRVSEPEHYDKIAEKVRDEAQPDA